MSKAYIHSVLIHCLQIFTVVFMIIWLLIWTVQQPTLERNTQERHVLTNSLHVSSLPNAVSSLLACRFSR